MDSCCVVCAEPLEWTAYGPCGHMDTCSKCVARLRLVMDDKRCVICQQESAVIYVSRYMGDYTTRLAPDQFPKLKERAKKGEVFHMAMISAYFDDEDHYKEIKSMSSFTHPILKNIEDPPLFRNIGALRKYIEVNCKKQFCGICLSGRKVFVSEQILYTKNELNRHLRQGDVEGPLAQAGFKGHPQCRFCNKRFYGDAELFAHNHQHHETCFLCRRKNPDRYTYFRDYDHLEEHFREAHFPCPHPECLEKKFVVFHSEAELKQHFIKEHGGGNMSRAQMREALSLETNFRFRRPEQEETAPPEVDQRAGIVIGGGGNVRSRHGRFQPRIEPEVNQAIQNSLNTAAAESSSRGQPTDRPPPVEQRQLTPADFPLLPEGSAGPSGRGLSAPGGTWAGSGLNQGAGLRAEDFPGLPVQSRNAKRRAKAKEKKTMAEQLQSRAGQVKVVQRGGGSSGGPSAGPSSTSAQRPATMSAALTRPPAAQVNPLGNPQAPGPRPLASRPLTAPPTQQSQLRATPPPTAPKANLKARDFPALGSSDAGSSSSQGLPKWNARNQAKPAPKPKPQTMKPATPGPEDFPTLGGFQSAGQGSSSASSSSPAWNGAAHVPSARVKMTSGLKAAQKAMTKKIGQQLSDEQFKEVQKATERFTAGSLSADDYHDLIIRNEIAHIASDLISVCPVPQARADLLEVHKRFVEFAEKHPEAAPTQVPAQVLVAGLKNIEKKQAWFCSKCKVANAPQADYCELCDQERSVGGDQPRGGSKARSRPGPNEGLLWGGGSSSGGLGRSKNGLFGGSVQSKNATSVWGKKK